MEDVIKLFTPYTQHPPLKDDNVQIIESTTWTVTYFYEGHRFNSKDEAERASAIFSYISEGIDNMTLPEIDALFFQLINTDMGPRHQNKYVYDLDVIPNVQMDEDAIKYHHDQYYVHISDFEESCPHKTHHPFRYSNRKLVSCYPGKLDLYIKLMEWRHHHLKTTPIEPPPVGTYTELSNLETKIIEIIYSRTGVRDPPRQFEMYRAGIDKKLNINTPSRNRFYYDPQKYEWVTLQVIRDTYEMDDNQFQRQKSNIDTHYEGVNDLLNLIKGNGDISMNILAKIFISLPSNVELEDDIKIDVEAMEHVLHSYYSQIHLFTNHVFNLSTFLWELEADKTFVTPQVKGVYRNLTSHHFIDIISKINIINRLTK
jgi:hypothetical protein